MAVSGLVRVDATVPAFVAGTRQYNRETSTVRDGRMYVPQLTAARNSSFRLEISPSKMSRMCSSSLWVILRSFHDEKKNGKL